MKIIARGLAAALLAGAAFAAVPAMAKEAKVEAPKPVKLSKPVQNALAEAQKLTAAGDIPGAMAKIAEAEAFPTPTPDDSYMTLAIKLNAAIAAKDNVIIEAALTKMLASGKVPAADQPKFYKTVGSLALNRKDYNAATIAFQELIKLTPNDSEALIGLAELYYSQKLSAKAVEAINNAIAVNKAAGTTPPEAWYRRSLAIAYDGKIATQVQPTALALVQAYPNPVNWRDALVITRDSYTLDDQGSLDFMRLQAVTNSLNGEKDFLEYADTALGKGLPGEASYAVAEGLKRNMLSTSKPYVAELKKSADSKVAADKASLPGLEKDVKTSPKLALVTGDAYYGYGDYAKAAGLYRQATALPTVDAATANLRLGMALARSGDKAGATAAFEAVKGGPREALAKYWLLYLSQTA